MPVLLLLVAVVGAMGTAKPAQAACLSAGEATQGSVVGAGVATENGRSSRGGRGIALEGEGVMRFGLADTFGL
jgi:hypothetical protein